MLEINLLDELKTNMPRRYTGKVISAYRKRYNESISRWTVMRFFTGETYSEELHNAVLDVASAQQLLKQKTTEVINA